MKLSRLFLSLSCLVLGCSSLFAQTPAAAKPANTLPVSRVAWINSNAFADEAGGIKALVRVLKELELEFSGTQDELSLMAEKLRTIAGEINKLQSGGEANAQAIQEKQTAGLKLQRELQTKQQQAQAAITQAQQEKQGPLSIEIGKAITAFAKEREIGLLFDVAKLNDGIIAAQPELDLTKAFIAHFNETHP